MPHPVRMFPSGEEKHVRPERSAVLSLGHCLKHLQPTKNIFHEQIRSIAVTRDITWRNTLLSLVCLSPPKEGGVAIESGGTPQRRMKGGVRSTVIHRSRRPRIKKGAMLGIHVREEFHLTNVQETYAHPGYGTCEMTTTHSI